MHCVVGPGEVLLPVEDAPPLVFSFFDEAHEAVRIAWQFYIVQNGVLSCVETIARHSWQHADVFFALYRPGIPLVRNYT